MDIWSAYNLAMDTEKKIWGLQKPKPATSLDCYLNSVTFLLSNVIGREIGDFWNLRDRKILKLRNLDHSPSKQECCRTNKHSNRSAEVHLAAMLWSASHVTSVL